MSYTPSPTAACTRCGNPLMPGDAHCRNCGQPVAGATSPPPPGAGQGAAPPGPPPQPGPPQGPTPGLPPVGPPPAPAASTQEDDSGVTRRFVPGEVAGAPAPAGTPPGVAGPPPAPAGPPPGPPPPPEVVAPPPSPPLAPGPVTYGPPPGAPAPPPPAAPPGAPGAPGGGGYQEAPTQVVPGAAPPPGAPGSWPPVLPDAGQPQAAPPGPPPPGVPPPGPPQAGPPPPAPPWQGPTVYPGAPPPSPETAYGAAPPQRAAIVPPKGPANAVARIAFVLAVVGGAGMIAAAFLPVFSGLPSGVGGNSLINGTDKSDAYGFIACGAGAVLVGLLFNLRVVAGSFLRFLLAILVAGAAGFALYLGIHDLGQANDAVNALSGSGIGVGIALYAGIAGAGVGILAGLLECFGRDVPGR